jgi:hypothetical protein
VFFSHLDFFEKALFSAFAYFFIGSLIFWEFSPLSSLCIVLSIPCQKFFFSHSVDNLFNLVTISFVVQSFLISFSPICQFFLLVAEPFEFYLRSHCLYLLIPVYSLPFPALASKFQAFIKVLNPLCVDTYIGPPSFFKSEKSGPFYVIFFFHT